MRAVIFVPGNPGSKMSLAGAGEIWPPDFVDIIFGYQKATKLLDPNVVATGIIDTVLLPCAQFYQPIDCGLTDICAQLGAVYAVFPYDWRKNISHSADLLADAIQDLCTKNPSVDDITLVCHSNGGLVARFLLEATKHSKTKWFGYITQLLCICTPHLGAPRALSICMGLEDDMTIRAVDLKIICPDHRYPSAYQLLPAPNHTALWDTTTGTEVPRDFYQTSMAKTIGLDLTNLGVAKSTFTSLNNFTNKPKKISYQFVVGTNQSTERGVDICFHTGGYFTATPQSNDNSGDGTVPIWSAGYVGTGTGILPPWPTPGDHVGILATAAFQNWLYAYFKLVRFVETATQQSNVVISLNKRVYSPDERMNILIIPDEETEDLNGSLKIRRVSSIRPQVFLTSYGADKEITYRGGRAPYIQFTMFAPARPGAYQISLEGGSHTTRAGSNGWFAVSPISNRGRLVPHRDTRRRRRR